MELLFQDLAFGAAARSAAAHYAPLESDNVSAGLATLPQVVQRSYDLVARRHSADILGSHPQRAMLPVCVLSLD